MGSRRQAREAACQILYQMDLREEWDEAHILSFWNLLERQPDRESRKYAEAIVGGVLRERPRLDEQVEKAARNWSLDRMGMIDRNILRAAAWEMTGEPALSPGIVIDEWLDIARDFGSDDSPAFVNGILDRIAQDHKASSRSDA